MERKCLREHSYTDNDTPLVSVVMIAYNVERYITQAIDSVLEQKTNFKVELVIGEDCSKDKTREIVLTYQNKYPNIIRVLLHQKNLGLTPNCVATHNASSGKYIALLDGDDYWTDENKLQTQIDFLEINELYAGTGHQSVKIYDLNPGLEHLFGETMERDYELEDTITHRKFHTSSFVYRKWIWDKTGGIPTNISSNERAIYPIVAIFGKIKYFPEKMCVYRLSGLGLSSRVDYKELETDLNMIPWIKKLNPNFPTKRFKSFLHLCIFTYGTKKMPLRPLLKHYVFFVLNSFSDFPRNMKHVKWGTIFMFKRMFSKPV
jgi:glycosyltransferase involved in cell wall biosynthesis